MRDTTVDRTFQAYYTDVGSKALISAKEEHRLLKEYKTCTSCKRAIPHVVPRRNCPNCGHLAPEGIPKGRPTTCSSCTTKFDVYGPPLYCPSCGTLRNTSARNALLDANLRFVVRIAKKFARNASELQRYISAGNVGLILAADKYEFKHNTRFLTYAAWWIRKEIWDELHRSSLVHIPVHRQKDKETVPSYVSYGDLQLADLQDMVQAEPEPVLLTVESPENSSAQILRRTLYELDLRPRDLYIILQHYGLAEEARRSDEKLLGQIAAVAGVTAERVRQIRDSVLRKLRDRLHKQYRVDCVADLL